MRVDEHGPADAPTIVFLHGGGGGGWMWRPQVEGLPDYHLLVPDLLRSPPPLPDWTGKSPSRPAPGESRARPGCADLGDNHGVESPCSGNFLVVVSATAEPKQGGRPLPTRRY